MENVNIPSYEELVSVINYLSQIPDENVRKLGFAVILDGRKGTVKQVRIVLRACQEALYRQVRYVLLIQPERFLDQQKFNFELIKEAYQFKITDQRILVSIKCNLVPLHKLSRFVDVSQLPRVLGGTLPYDPCLWILLRQKLENYVKRVNSWIEKSNSDVTTMSCRTEEKTFKVISSDSNELLKAGDDLLDEITQNFGEIGGGALKNTDWDNAVHHINVLMKQIKDINVRPREMANGEERDTLVSLLVVYNEGVNNLTDWILGAGQRWLQTLHEIGESYDDAKQLEVKKQSRELVALGRELQRQFPQHTVALQQNIDSLQQLVNAFCTRVVRQKQVAVRSANFYHMLTDFSRKTNGLLEALCTNVKANDIGSAEKERNEIEVKLEEMEKIYQSMITAGASFIDKLSVDESNSIDREVLEESHGRRQRCQHLAGVRRLKIHQLLQLYTCEKDCQQVVLWVEELYETLVNGFDEILRDFEQLHLAQENRIKVEDTARSIYGYGKQLCQVMLVLRRSLRMGVQPGLNLNQRLESIWGKFGCAVKEKNMELGTIGAFHSTVHEVIGRLDELLLQLDGKALQRGAEGTSLTDQRMSIANDIQVLEHITDSLIQELNNKVSRKRNNGDSFWIRVLNLIQQKFAEVRRKQSKLERIREEENVPLQKYPGI